MFYAEPEFQRPLLHPRHIPKGRKEISHPKKLTTPNSFLRKKILIVEDEALVAENLKDVLERDGYKVVGVLSTGEDAILTVSKTRVDIILMDIRLAGELNGLETVALIHQTMQQMPVIFLTAYAVDRFPQLSNISPSLYRFIAKPYNQRDLERAIRELCSSGDSSS